MTRRLDVPDEERCRAYVYRRDCYRRTGRGPSGFSMHYDRGRCGRRAVMGGLCRQHREMHRKWPNYLMFVDQDGTGMYRRNDEE